MPSPDSSAPDSVGAWRGISGWDRRVLEGARTLQRGEVTSYGRLARRIGAPGAARAVGAALGRNPFWLLIPCHRIVAGDGSIGGYGGGADAIEVNRSHREDADHDGDLGVVPELDADFALAHQVGHEPALALGQADIAASGGRFHGGHLVALAVELEAASELVHRNVRPRLDEASQLRRGRSALEVAVHAR